MFWAFDWFPEVRSHSQPSKQIEEWYTMMPVASSRVYLDAYYSALCVREPRISKSARTLPWNLVPALHCCGKTRITLFNQLVSVQGRMMQQHFGQPVRWRQLQPCSECFDWHQEKVCLAFDITDGRKSGAEVDR